MFLFGDMLVFGAFFAVFMVERGKDPNGFDVARKTLHLDLGLTNTFVLLASSLGVVIALRAIRVGARRAARSATAISMGFGTTFVAIKVTEYYKLVGEGHHLNHNIFYTYYFALTGIHLLHVFIGLLVLAFLFRQATHTDASIERVAMIEGGACFWHLVDMLWIVLFPLLYLVS